MFTVIANLICSGILFQVDVLSTVELGWNNMTSFLVGLSDIGIHRVIRNDCLK